MCEKWGLNCHGARRLRLKYHANIMPLSQRLPIYIPASRPHYLWRDGRHQTLLQWIAWRRARLKWMMNRAVPLWRTSLVCSKGSHVIRRDLLADQERREPSISWTHHCFLIHRSFSFIQPLKHTDQTEHRLVLGLSRCLQHFTDSVLLGLMIPTCKHIVAY